MPWAMIPMYHYGFCLRGEENHRHHITIMSYEVSSAHPDRGVVDPCLLSVGESVAPPPRLHLWGEHLQNARAVYTPNLLKNLQLHYPFVERCLGLNTESVSSGGLFLE